MARIGNDELERIFDEGGDITEYMDLSTALRPNMEATQEQRVTLNITDDLAHGLDRAARRMGVSRQTVMKVWLSERLDEEADREARRVALA